MIRRPTPSVGEVLWVAPMLLACGAGGTDGPGAPPPESHSVEIRNMEFQPDELRVRPGDTVIWVNRDIVPHTATAPDSAWTSPPLAQGERWRMVADTPGPRSYICAFHPVMEARLIVDSFSSP